MPIPFQQTLLLLCLSATAAGAGEAGLSCQGPASAPEPTERLCAALIETVRQRHGRELRRVPAGEAALLRLEVAEAGPTGLSARLSWAEPAGMRTGPLVELSVVDRDTIPDGALARLARSLLSLVGPDLPDAALPPDLSDQ